MSMRQPDSDEPEAGGGRFEPFDLTVNLGPDATPWLSAASRVGFVHGIPRRSKSLPPLSELLYQVYDYTDAIKYAEGQPAPELTRILGELVFGDPVVLQLFQATRGVAADRGRQLLCRILAAPHLAGLPWELLPDPATAQSEGLRYLALAPNTHLVRLARGRNYTARAPLLEAPLNLLLVLSSPTPKNLEEDELSFDIFEVKRALLTELAELQQAGMMHIDVVDRPTLDNLRRQIGKQRRGYHLFHYVGHAEPDHLILEDRAGERKDLDSSQFMEVLRLCPDLRLAVFAGCKTACAARDPAMVDAREAVGWRDLLSLADYCVQEACPAVIGMQAVLGFGTERVFTRFFYQALAHGYSIAEALQLARGAIQGDEHRRGDLLDWSVPALFIGNSDPGPLLPRSAVPREKAGPTRWDLKLGLRQSDERFYGRELPLRQAVDILAGAERERVLSITGVAGVGKTELLDRTLEELGTAVTHVLYVAFDRLAPKVAQASRQLDQGSMPDLAVLAGLDPDSALERLCSLVTELLGEEVTHPRDPDWNIREWWERLVQDVVQHRFVLAIEDIALDRLQRGLLEWLVDRWVQERAAADRKAMSPEQLLDRRLELLSQLQESLEQNAGSPQPKSVASALAQLQAHLKDLPDRLVVERARVLSDSLERLVLKLSYQATGGDQGDQAPPAAALKPAVVKKALNQLEQVRETLSWALRILADRRSPARIVITAREKPHRFLDLPGEQMFEMRLAPLGWPETWRWIRHSLPGLLSYTEDYLSQLWSRLGTQLDRWEELERRVLRDQGRGQTVNIQKLTEEIVPRPVAVPASPGTLLTRRRERALRIAVAGPNLAGPRELAEAITRLAIKHGIGGRAVLDAREGGALATLIDEPSLFADKPTVDDQGILEWLQRVLAKQVDIILLDYAAQRRPDEINGPQGRSAERTLLRSVHCRTLLIAGGGNEGQDSPWVATPSAYPEVLGVGPIDDERQLRPYAQWSPELRKPDLFMTDQLAGTPLASALKPEFSKESPGSSFAALHAVATATLVWSILPELPPRAVRKLLIDASREIAETKHALSLTIADAVDLARRRAAERGLREGPASLQTLGAMTGLDARVLENTLGKMDNVVRLTSGRLERYQLVPIEETHPLGLAL